MTWINDTSLGQEHGEVIELDEPSEPTIADLINNLFVSGCRKEYISDWIGQVDLSKDLNEQLRTFILTHEDASHYTHVVQSPFDAGEKA